MPVKHTHLRESLFIDVLYKVIYDQYCLDIRVQIWAKSINQHSNTWAERAVICWLRQAEGRRARKKINTKSDAKNCDLSGEMLYIYFYVVIIKESRNGRIQFSYQIWFYIGDIYFQFVSLFKCCICDRDQKIPA